MRLTSYVDLDLITLHFFRVTVESVLIYGSVIWILTKALENKFNGNCT